MTNEERVSKFKNEKIAINCETEDEAKEFIKWCYLNEMYWICYKSELVTKFNLYKSHTAYVFNYNEGNGIGFCDKKWFEDIGYEIIKYTDFMKEEEREEGRKMTNLEWLFKDGRIDVYADNNSEYGKMIVEIKTNKLNRLIDECLHSADILDYLLAKHKEPIKLTRMEYDLLKCYAVGKTKHSFNGIDCLRELKCEGHFKAVDETMKIKDILNDCEIVE